MRIGTTLVVLGVAVNPPAAAQHTRYVRQLASEQRREFTPSSLGVVVAVSLSAVGLGMAAYLVALPR